MFGSLAAEEVGPAVYTAIGFGILGTDRLRHR